MRIPQPLRAVTVLTLLAAPACRFPAASVAALVDPTCQNVTHLPTDSTPLEVKWLRAPTTREHASLDRWCAGVGPAVAYRFAAPTVQSVTVSQDAATADNSTAAAVVGMSTVPATNAVNDKSSRPAEGILHVENANEVPGATGAVFASADNSHRRTSKNASDDSFVVITWNTHVGGGDIAGLVKDVRAGRYTDGVPVQHFALLLQEVYRAADDVPRNVRAIMPKRIHSMPKKGERQDIVATARALGMELFYVPSMSNRWADSTGAAEDRGNAILSTLPLRDLAAIELPYEGQRRVAASATVGGVTMSGEAWELRLVNAHFDNRARWSRVYRSLGAARTRQAHALVQLLELEKSTAPTVLGGDLNTWSYDRFENAVEVLAKHFPLPNKRIMEPTLAIENGFGSMRVDHLMFRLGKGHTVDTQRLDDARGSDHYPLLGRIRFGDAVITADRERVAPPQS